MKKFKTLIIKFNKNFTRSSLVKFKKNKKSKQDKDSCEYYKNKSHVNKNYYFFHSKLRSEN